MLSTRLKRREVSPDRKFDSKKKTDAKVMLHEIVNDLVLGMRVAQEYGDMTQREVENYVISQMEKAEAHYYKDTPQDFDIVVKTILGGCNGK